MSKIPGTRIHVTIDKLVLSGLDPAARHAFVASLKQQLAQTLANPAARAEWARSQRTPILRLSPTTLNTGPNVGSGGARTLASHVATGISQNVRRGVKR